MFHQPSGRNWLSDGTRRNSSWLRIILVPSKSNCIDWPNCWMALSALQGSSSVMWTLLLWFFTRRSACKEIPELAASEMMAMFCLRSSHLLTTKKQEMNETSTPRKLSKYLLSIHEPLFLCQIEDFHGDVEFWAGLIGDAAIVVAHHATFATSHLQENKIFLFTWNTTYQK